MHHRSGRILRWTEDDRPYTKEFQDLFCTLMVALPLGRHRVGLRKRDNTFTTNEALSHLHSLRLSSSNKRISPDNPAVIITTKAVTTFSMPPHMARSLCNRFLAARLVESCDSQTEFLQLDKVWQLTPKGISLVSSFAHRHGVQDYHVFSLLDSARNTMRLLVLERDSETDRLIRDPATLEVVFRRFVGMENPNAQNGTAGSDTDSVNESPNGVLGVKQSQRKIGMRIFSNAFTGKAAVDWLMNCCTLADEVEAEELLSLFQVHHFIVCLKDARTEEQKASSRFQFSKSCLHMVTDEGLLLVRRAACKENIVSNDAQRAQGAARDSNASRMMVIATTPSLRLLFREFLRDTHCEENLVFFMEVKDFLARWDAALKRQTDGTPPPLDTIRQTMAAAYDLYNDFLAPGSPCELNIDHNLRNAMITRMTKFELPETELLSTVDSVTQLFDQAKGSVFKLMASDSVPKFMRDPKYAQALYENNLEIGPNHSTLTQALAHM